MSVNLADYNELLENLTPANRSLIEAEWPEAVKCFSSQGLRTWIEGIAALQQMGRSDYIVESWIEHIPQLTKEIGDNVVGEFSHQCLQFASRTSAAVIEKVIETSPVAAKRLGDSELFLGYLQLLNVMLAQAPRGLRPMLGKLDELLAVLTLGGLRRWVLWGAKAHRNRFEEQVRYFELESEEAKAMLQKERKGTLFVDIHRRLSIYLRALWGRDFFMRPTAGEIGDGETIRPFISDFFVHLPDAYDEIVFTQDNLTLTGIDCYRSAAAHCAAHIVATNEVMASKAYSNIEKLCIEIFEDARIEKIAIDKFPRLKHLWLPFHHQMITNQSLSNQAIYFNRLALSLLDENYKDNDRVIVELQKDFKNLSQINQEASINLGLKLASILNQQKININLRRDKSFAEYRDDNQYFWQYSPYTFDAMRATELSAPQQVRKYVSVMEMVNEVEVETAGDDAQEIWVCESEFFDDDGISFNEKEGKEPVSEPCHYDEFDYQLQSHRPLWATVLERRPKKGDIEIIDDIVAQNKKITERMKVLLESMQPQGVQRIRNLEEGDELDINAAVQAMIDLRLGVQPDPRYMMRNQRNYRDIAILVLLDLSESTNEYVVGQDFTILELTRSASVLLAEAINKVGDKFAIHGFSSDGRHNVFYQRYKEFSQGWDDTAKARLAGLNGRLSTRMGAAIRHASAQFTRVEVRKKLMIMVTDGEPADIDCPDPLYLQYDARTAIEEAERNGIIPFCLTLDSRADAYASKIFGPRNYLILDQIARLPERLPMLYAGLTR